jgi:hypothetical protein
LICLLRMDSLCEGRGCAGLFSDILNVRESYALGSHATVFQSKVYAILACLEYCISEGIVNRAISICSENMAALLAFKSYAMPSRVVLQCRDALQEMALSNRVRLVWVPGHCGIHGNPWPVTGRTSLPKITTFKNHKNCMICSFSNTFTVYLLNLRINYSF